MTTVDIHAAPDRDARRVVGFKPDLLQSSEHDLCPGCGHPIAWRLVLDALVAGETDPEKLVELTQGRLKAPRETLIEALRGNVRDHHRFLIKLHLDQVDALNTAVRELEARVEEHLGPFRKNVEILTTMPGLSETAARVIVSEIGCDMAQGFLFGAPEPSGEFDIYCRPIQAASIDATVDA